VKIRDLLLALCGLFVFLVSGCAYTSKEERKLNQEYARPIIQALDKYVQKHGVAPKELGMLIPEYLPEAPKTTEDAEFEYEMELGLYVICFRINPWIGKGDGCCYSKRFAEWECSPVRNLE